MSDIDQTLCEVGALLDLLPGCEMLGTDLQNDRAVIELLVEHREALVVLEDVSQAANARLAPWVDLRNEPPVGAVRLTLSPMVSPFERIDHGNLQLVGIHLAWHLHRVGLLTTRDANKLLKCWNAALVTDA
jgi:hypothetical protein